MVVVDNFFLPSSETITSGLAMASLFVACEMIRIMLLIIDLLQNGLFGSVRTFSQRVNLADY